MSGARGALTVAVSVALCCGVGWLLVAAGVMAASAGLFSSPELTVAAIALAGWGVVRLVAKLRRLRVEEGR